MLKRMPRIFAVTVTLVGMLSGITAFPLLICLMAILVSSIVGGPTSIGRSVGAASMLGGFSEACRFKSSLKSSTRLFRCSAMLVITSPSLLFIGHSGLR
ncbi:unnamed protein product [Schistosoma mattheei]|uniref:Uncharacterized protein n=1 Tax=Schistosoma mattheei TaxID=31246 RepID=A0A3P8K295_9TREM|nr:unnamed protein product [Schistosoma mattheei]